MPDAHRVRGAGMRLPPQKLDARQVLKELALLTWCGALLGAGAYVGWQVMQLALPGGC